jgi:hypothetical protein
VFIMTSIIVTSVSTSSATSTNSKAALKAAIAGASKSKEAARLLAAAYIAGESLPTEWATEFKRDAVLMAAMVAVKAKIQAHLPLEVHEQDTANRYALCVLVAQWRSQYNTLRANGITLQGVTDTVVAAFRRATIAGLLLRDSEGKLKSIKEADKEAQATDTNQAMPQGTASADIMARVLRVQEYAQAAMVAFNASKGANKASAMTLLQEALQGALRELAEIAN